MFLVVWLKVLSFLAVFKNLRYMVKMIIETIKELATFLIILGIAIVAYAQIMYTTYLMSDFETRLKGSYGLAFGDFSDM